MVEVRRKKSESFESLLRRFTRRMQESGKVLQAKKIRFFNEKPNKTQARASALRREEKRVMRNYLLRAGKLVEEHEGRGRNNKH